MTRWLDYQRVLLEKEYVMLKIDDVRDINGEEVAKRISETGSRDSVFRDL